MAAGTRHLPVRPALAGALALTFLAMSVGTAQGVTSPSPSPSASASAADPSPSPSSSESAEPTLNEITTNDENGLAVGIDRWIPYTSTATAVGGNGLATTTLPIPKGLVPIKLRGRLVSVADTPGVVRIRVGTNWVEMDAEKGGLFELALPIDAAVDDAVTVEVRNTLEPGKGECEGDFTTTETIQDLELGFIGRETPPTTIAGFFSPPVQKVTLVSPDTSDLDVIEATLAGAGAIATRYTNTTPIVSQTESQFAADPTALSDANGPNRIVRIAPNDADIVSVDITNPGVPTMTLSGPADKLAVAAASLASPGLGLAAVANATELAEERFGVTAYTLTLAELGAEKPTLSGLGRLTFSLPLAQDRFGSAVDAFDIHLEGAHTPVPEGGLSTASILWNDQLVASQNLENNDDYAVDVSIDPSLVRRDNFLVIRVDATPPGGNCGNAVQPMQLDINGLKSTVSATPGQSLRTGFTRFPQAFDNTLHVAFGSGAITPELISAACSMIVSLQHASSQQMEITAEGFDTFLGAAYPGMVIGATPSDANALKAPLRYEEWRAVNTLSTDFTVTVDRAFAALEAFEFDGRNILMLGGTAPPEVSEPLITKIADEAENGEFGWFALRDDLLIAQPNADLLFMASSGIVPQTTVTAEGRALPPWWILIIGVIAALILIRWLWGRRRKRLLNRRIAAAQAAEESVTDAAQEMPPELS